MNKPNLLQKLTSVGIASFGTISAIGIATAPAQAFTLNTFHAIGWDNGTSQFYDDAFDAFTPGGDFTVTFCNPGETLFDCGATIEDAQGDYEPIFDIGFRYGVTSDPTVNFVYVRDVDDPDFADAADFRLANALDFTMVGIDGIETTQTLPEGSIVRGEIEFDGALEFELAAGERVDPEDLNNVIPGNGEWDLTIPGMSATADRSVFEFGITSNQVNSGVYDAEAEVLIPDPNGRIPEPTTILGLLVFSGLGLGLKRKKNLLKAG